MIVTIKSGALTTREPFPPEGAPIARAAEWYARRSIAIFPVRQQGKTPLTTNGHKDATCDPKMISAYWKRWPKANIGIPTGIINKFFVLDVDRRNGGIESLAEIVLNGVELPITIETATGGGGRHLYFNDSGLGLACQQNIGGKGGLDLKADGGYIVGAPSVHESGGVYRWSAGLFLGVDLPAQASDSLLAFLRQSAHLSVGKSSQLPAELKSGERDTRLFKNACLLVRGGGTEDEVLDWLQIINNKRCRPPLSDWQLRKIAHSAIRYQAQSGAPRESGRGAR